jgi:hypothetical protein
MKMQKNETQLHLEIVTAEGREDLVTGEFTSYGFNAKIFNELVQEVSNWDVASYVTPEKIVTTLFFLYHGERGIKLMTKKHYGMATCNQIAQYLCMNRITVKNLEASAMKKFITNATSLGISRAELGDILVKLWGDKT